MKRGQPSQLEEEDYRENSTHRKEKTLCSFSTII